MKDPNGYHTVYPTADLVVLIDWTEIVLIQRAKDPYKDRSALPGGHIDEGERPVDAAARETMEETGLAILPIECELLMILDKLGRDPRPGHDFSICFVTNMSGNDPRLSNLKAASDAKQVLRRKLSELCPADLAFDHWDAIDYLLWWHPEVKRANG